MAGFPYSWLSKAFLNWSKSPMVGLPARAGTAVAGIQAATLADRRNAAMDLFWDAVAVNSLDLPVVTTDWTRRAWT
jgi:hypothetical protein